jgi:C4-dicarboxylate transporter DctQ subunit
MRVRARLQTIIGGTVMATVRAVRLMLRAQWVAEVALIYLERTMLFVLFAFVTFNVVARDVFNHPYSGEQDISVLIIAATAFLGVSYTQALRGHIGMDLILRLLPKAVGAIVDMVVLILVLAAFVFACWFIWAEAIFTYQINETSPTVGLPIWWSKVCVGLGLSLLCVRFAIQIGQDALELVRGGRRHTPTLARVRGEEAAEIELFLGAVLASTPPEGASGKESTR